MLSIYKTFLDNISTEDQVEEVCHPSSDFASELALIVSLIQFLANLPPSQGGLYPVAVSLFHPSKEVRKATVELFKRFDTIQVSHVTLPLTVCGCALTPTPYNSWAAVS